MKAGLEAVVRALDLKSLLGESMMFWGSNRVEILWAGLCTFSSTWLCCGGKQAVVLLEGSCEGGYVSREWERCINHIQVFSTTQRRLIDLVVEYSCHLSTNRWTATLTK